MIWQVFVDGRMNAYWKDSQKLLRNCARDQSRQKSVHRYKDDFPRICPVHQHHWRWTLRKVPSSKLSRISFFVSNFTLESTWLLGHQTPAAWKQTQSNPGRQSKAWKGNYDEKVWQRWHLVSSDLLTTTTSPTRALFSPPPTSWQHKPIHRMLSENASIKDY